MIEPPQLFTHERLVFDIREIESLATLIMDLGIPIDRALCESFERLVELAGTRDFIVSFSKLHEYMFQIKSKQNSIVDSGSIVPPAYLIELADWTKNQSMTSSDMESSKTRFGGLIGRGFNRSMHPTEENSSFMDSMSINHISPNKNFYNFDIDVGILYLSDSDSDLDY